MSKCPDCGNELRILINDKMNFKIEEIPICGKCQVTFRDPNLVKLLFVEVPIGNQDILMRERELHQKIKAAYNIKYEIC